MAGHVESNRDRLPGVKRIIAVGSGKGGVGISTVAVYLAISLRKTGATVGLLDADIYGPSMPIMLGVKYVRPKMSDDHTIAPVDCHGLVTISMGFMLQDSDAVVWRGPMLGKALQQFIEDVSWGELDYLVVDLPPGTGDVQLSLSQLIPMDGAIVVTTPQDVAFADVRRAIRMFELTKIPVLGLVENMSYFIAPDTQARYDIFGTGRTASHCEALSLSFLGQLPLDMQIGPAADQGQPVCVADPEGEQAGLYEAMVVALQSELSKRDAAQAGGPAKFGSFFSKES